MTATLPILVVETNHSRYEIDQNRGVYTRTRIHEDAGSHLGYGIGDSGEEREYQKIYAGPEVGAPLVIVHGDGSWVRSTVVKLVTEKVPVE